MNLVIKMNIQRINFLKYVWTLNTYSLITSEWNFLGKESLQSWYKSDLSEDFGHLFVEGFDFPSLSGNLSGKASLQRLYKSELRAGEEHNGIVQISYLFAPSTLS